MCACVYTVSVCLLVHAVCMRVIAICGVTRLCMCMVRLGMRACVLVRVHMYTFTFNGFLLLSPLACLLWPLRIAVSQI